MIEPLTVAGTVVTLGGASVGFPAGGPAKVLGRTVAVRSEVRVAGVRGG